MFITHEVQLQLSHSVHTEVSPESYVYAALLHDVVEDEGVMVDELRGEFTDAVADIVKDESEDKQKERPANESWKDRKHRKQKTINHLNDPNTEYYVKLVAFADKLANLRAIAHDYRAIGEEVWKRFNQSDSKEIRRYYTAVYEACKEFEPCREYKEYGDLLREVFVEKIHIAK